MGCTQSTPESRLEKRKAARQAAKRKGVGHTERLHRVVGAGHTERLLRKQEISAEPAPPVLDSLGNLTSSEIIKRIRCSKKTESMKFGNTTLRYAFLTQRGYYPDDVHKPNQDAYFIEPNFAGNDDDIFFAVYDGHGDHGDECSKFAKHQLPRLVAKYVRQVRATEYKEKLQKEGKSMRFKPDEWPLLKKEQYEEVCRKAHLECNSSMHKEVKVNDNLSGTTAISVAFHADRITVCNVGDSRALLGRKVPVTSEDSSSEPNNLVAVALSRDQTPFREDERLRVKKFGSRVMTIDQLSGKEPIHENWVRDSSDGDIAEDPPRVWCQHGEYPGTAFTRSIGDKTAEDLCGVFAEPEIITKDLASNDQLLVLASDGLFEFLSNKNIIDICAKHDDPLKACQDVVAQSYELWLKHEVRTDDMTVICIFIEREGETEDDTQKNCTPLFVGDSKPTQMNEKPAAQSQPSDQFDVTQ